MVITALPFKYYPSIYHIRSIRGCYAAEFYYEENEGPKPLSL